MLFYLKIHLLKDLCVNILGMDARHKTLKRVSIDNTSDNQVDELKTLLEAGARDAYSRPWHRIERGLRLNRLRIFIEDIAPQYNMTKEEKESLFLFLQKALDKKLLNTLKIVQYNQETQRIVTINGLEIKRSPEGQLKWGFVAKKVKADVTRRKKKEEQ
jgi:hypothetical protein